ncbi:P-loop containing nucleoside triphosphate hydrolase protein [Apodospora peruviana]|uniref:Gluconokinase n=1 Tax=Apodospora peruviana TaxID=516989 RepID=A0AAE0ISQ8_9PEZI|nr:P-loop containing nucleoside triphosphate hydrolase protein [Apodospora peruviana]
MLSNPVSLNGQGHSSATLSVGRQTVPSSPKATRLPAPGLSNGVLTNGITQANGSTTLAAAHRPEKDHHIWLVTGPAGCGKSTVAKYLASTLHLPYIEGDEFHPQANIDKMSAGIPLTDADRWDWLTALREASIHELDKGSDGVVLTCSALKRKYRDVIRVAPYFVPNIHLHFIFLHAPEEVLLKRVLARQNHYMGANMVHSQFDILEPPTSDEIDVLAIDVSRPAEDVLAEALDRVLNTMDGIAARSQK